MDPWMEPQVVEELKDPRQERGFPRAEKGLNDRPMKGLHPEMAPGRRKVKQVTAPDGEE